MLFGEYCPVCDEFVDLGLPRTEGDIIICPNGHKLVYRETDSQFMDCRFEYEKWVERQRQIAKPGYV